LDQPTNSQQKNKARTLHSIYFKTNKNHIPPIIIRIQVGTEKDSQHIKLQRNAFFFCPSSLITQNVKSAMKREREGEKGTKIPF